MVISGDVVIDVFRWLCKLTADVPNVLLEQGRKEQRGDRGNLDSNEESR